MEKKFDGNYTRMLQAILNRSWRQHPTKQQLYDHLPPITKTIQVRRTRYARHYTRMLRATLNRSWRQQPTKQQLYGHLPPITKTIQVRRTWHAGHCWRSGDKLISDVLLLTPSCGWAKAGRPARTYIQQLCANMGCDLEGLPEAMNDREGWRERVRDIRADGATLWWWNLKFSQILHFMS